MLRAEPGSDTAGNDGAQGDRTEAGQNPRETKPMNTEVSMAQAPTTNQARNTTSTIGSSSEAGSGGVTSKPQQTSHQRPTYLSQNLSTEASSLLTGLGVAQTSDQPSQTQHFHAETPQTVASDPNAPKHEEMSSGSHVRQSSMSGDQVMSETASNSTALSGVDAHSAQAAQNTLLALGAHASLLSTNKTRPLAPSSNTSSGHTASKVPIPSFSNNVGQPAAKPKPGNTLRRGKWTVEEEAYVARVIQDFNSGFLNAPAGTTLRSYLSDKLQCDPMRITKKFTGDSCIGKRVFHPAVRNPSNAASIDKAQAELDSLERRWRRRLEMQQRESAKKAAASAAAAASGRSHGFVTNGALCTGAGASTGTDGVALGGQNATPSHGVAQTASWLDRASNILKGTGSETGVSTPCAQQKFSLTQEQAQALQSLPRREIEMQMKEVERLIHEGPIIQQTSAGLPLVLNHSGSETSLPPPPVPTTIVAANNTETASNGQQTPPEPADKRLRTGAEDAEALVGFLTAVRASAAAGTDSFSS